MLRQGESSGHAPVGAVELARQARALDVAVRPEQAHDVRAGALKRHVAHHLQCMIIHECGSQRQTLLWVRGIALVPEPPQSREGIF